MKCKILFCQRCFIGITFGATKNMFNGNHVGCIFFSYYLSQFSETSQSPVGAFMHRRGKARRGGGAWLGFNVADCAPMKKGTVSSVLIFNFVAVCVPSLCVQFFFPP